MTAPRHTGFLMFSRHRCWLRCWFTMLFDADCRRKSIDVDYATATPMTTYDAFAATLIAWCPMISQCYRFRLRYAWYCLWLFFRFDITLVAFSFALMMPLPLLIIGHYSLPLFRRLRPFIDCLLDYALLSIFSFFEASDFLIFRRHYFLYFHMPFISLAIDIFTSSITPQHYIE